MPSGTALTDGSSGLADMRVWPDEKVRKGVEVRLGPGDRERLEAVIGSGNSSQNGAPPGFPGRAPGSRASHLGNIQTALLGRITPATTPDAPHRRTASRAAVLRLAMDGVRTHQGIKEGRGVNRKRVQRLMRMMGIEAMVPRPGTIKPAPVYKIYPYLLRGLAIAEPNHVWAADITYIPMARGFRR
jgi:hypothetical protein